MRIISFLFLLYLGASSFFIAIIIHSGLPSSHLIKGPNNAYVPIAICIINVILAIFSIYKGKKIYPSPLRKPSIVRWLLIALGIAVLFCGYTIFNVSIFTPYLLGSKNSLPEIGVRSWFITSFILSAILYSVSKMNSIERPNLSRFFALVIVFIAATLTTVQCLMLIYAVPVQPPVAFTFLSGLLTIATVPFSLLLICVARDYISLEKVSRKK